MAEVLPSPLNIFCLRLCVSCVRVSRGLTKATWCLINRQAAQQLQVAPFEHGKRSRRYTSMRSFPELTATKKNPALRPTVSSHHTTQSGQICLRPHKRLL